MLAFPLARPRGSICHGSITNVFCVRQIRGKNIQIAVINSKESYYFVIPREEFCSIFRLQPALRGSHFNVTNNIINYINNLSNHKINEIL